MTSEFIAALARDSLIFEVEATPKPGLVDRRNNGAHDDMDIQTFYRSAAALYPHFKIFAEEGRYSSDCDVLFLRLRELGKAAEKDMFIATNGINTHKGALFSIGLLCGAAAFLDDPDSESVCSLVAHMSRGICSAELSGLEKKETLTNGEKMFLKYGVSGVRGEAESGFKNVRQYALPVYKAALDSGTSQNDAAVLTLISLLSHVRDTNVLYRHNFETSESVKTQAAALLDSGFSLQKVEMLDNEFISKHISPGGCADLLAVTAFLYGIDCGKLP